MKALKITIIILTAAIFLTTTSQAKTVEKKPSKLTRYEQCIENLGRAITSENDGLRESAIYYAGKYKMVELKKTLIKQLSKEKIPSIRILISLSLYQIGDAEGIELVKEIYNKEKEDQVKRMCSDIFKEFENTVFSDSLEFNTTSR